jgi:Fe-S cluster biogenesis protein NfuA
MASQTSLAERADKVLDEIRPHLAADGGNVEVVEVTDDNTLLIKWLGNCTNCSMSSMTMKAGIEVAIKGQLPEIKSVKAIN